MTIAVRYQSKGGNTKAVAEIIASELYTKAYSIDTPISENVDILYIGGGVYGWRADTKLLDYINQLDPQKVKKIVAFSTSGSMTVTNKQIQRQATLRNIPVAEKSLCLKLMIQGHAALGKSGGQLNESQIAKIKDFVHID